MPLTIEQIGPCFAGRVAGLDTTRPLTPDEVAAMPQYAPETLRKTLVIGAADEVVDRLKGYEKMGYNQFSLWIDSGMSFARKKASLTRFIEHVMPNFQTQAKEARYDA